MRSYFFSLVALVIAITAFTFSTKKSSQSPCERTDIRWFFVKETTITNSINVAIANLDFSIPSLTGDVYSAIAQFGCANINNYCSIAFAPTNLDAQGRPKLGAVAICATKRSF